MLNGRDRPAVARPTATAAARAAVRQRRRADRLRRHRRSGSTTPASNTVYQGTLPQDKHKQLAKAETGCRRSPTIQKRSRPSSRKHGRTSPARSRATSPGGPPTRSASRRSTTAACSAPASSPGTPRKGVPLRAAVYAAGQQQSPVLELKATDISYGKVPASRLRRHAAAGRQGRQRRRAERPDRPARKHAKAAGHAGRHRRRRRLQGRCRSRSRRPPSSSASRATRSASSTGRASPAALVTYGQNLGGIAVIEQPADRPRRAAAAADRRHGDHARPAASRRSRSTAPPARSSTPRSATMIRFNRGGVAYTVARVGPAGGGRGRGRAAL